MLIKTKVIGTIGPRTQSLAMLGDLIDAGLNVVRLNFSHGTHDFHRTTIENVRAAVAARDGKEVAILLDTKGPEIRTGRLKDGADVVLETGQRFVLYHGEDRAGDGEGVSVTFAGLAGLLKPGNQVLIDDGLIALRVVGVAGERIDCEVLNGGRLGEQKGVNVPGVAVDLPVLTAKDREDLAFGVAMGVDFIAASFIRSAQDVQAIREALGTAPIQVIAKIENQQGVDNFEAILATADGIMVARGDLGVEVPVERVARLQKWMIKRCNAVGKPSITATQMLESMVVQPRPTRAEATDVANAVLDGSDAVMLSGETAKGAHPVQAVQMMVRICREAETDIQYAEVYAALRKSISYPIAVSEAVAAAAVKSAYDVKAACIIVLTQSGQMARAMAKYRPIPPVIAVTSCPRVARQCLVLRGLWPMVVDSMVGTERIVFRAMLTALQRGMAVPGDPVILTSGFFENQSGSTNMMRILACLPEMAV